MHYQMGKSDCSSVTIRAFRDSDAPVLRQLFFDTVWRVNSRHYTNRQLEVWASEDYDVLAWLEILRQLNPWVAEVGTQVAGYADVQADGYIDHFFCHYRHQGQGIGRRLMCALFERASGFGLQRLYADVSITARPFFERFGFVVTDRDRLSRNGVVLIRYRMVRVGLIKAAGG